MVDTTFVFLLVVTVGLGVRSLLDTYSVRELATRLFGLVALSFILLITLDFSVLQQPLGSGYGSSSPSSGGFGNLESGVGLSGGGKESMANWRQKLLPAGFGPGGMSLPPWSPYKVEEAGSTSMMPVGGAPGSVNNVWNGWAGGDAFGVPALNGMPGGAAVGYYPPNGGNPSGAGGGSVVIPGMAGSFVPGTNGMVWRPDPTKPPLPPPAPPPAPPPPDPVAAQVNLVIISICLIASSMFFNAVWPYLARCDVVPSFHFIFRR